MENRLSRANRVARSNKRVGPPAMESAAVERVTAPAAHAQAAGRGGEDAVL